MFILYEGKFIICSYRVPAAHRIYYNIFVFPIKLDLMVFSFLVSLMKTLQPFWIHPLSLYLPRNGTFVTSKLIISGYWI